MGPEDIKMKRFKADIDKWKNPTHKLIKKEEESFLNTPTKPSNPDLKLEKKSSDDPKKIKKWGFLSKPGEGGQNIVVGGAGVESEHFKASSIRIQPTKKSEWSGTTVIQGEVKLKSKKGKWGIGGRYDTSSKKISPLVSFKSSISDLFKRKKKKPEDFGYRY